VKKPNPKEIQAYVDGFLLFIGDEYEEIYAKITQLIEKILSEDRIVQFLNASVVEGNHKKSLISSFNPDIKILNLLSLTIKHKKSHMFIDILKNLTIALRNKIGIADVVVESMIEIKEDQKTKIEKLVRDLFKMDSRITNIINKNVIGGLIIKVNNHVLDLSIKNQFYAIKNRISKAL
jgi:F-type H+-transporting ATPase subunit delta